MQVIQRLRSSRSQERGAPEDASRTPKRLIRPLASFRVRGSTSSVSSKARTPRNSTISSGEEQQQAVEPVPQRVPFNDLVPRAASAEGVDAAPLQQVNGFKVQPAIDTLHVEAANVAPFSLPQELLTYTPSAEAITNHFRNGESERKIHCNIELSEEEQQKLGVMRDLAASQGKVFEPYLAIAATRYLGRVRGDPKKAVREMAATQEWRKGFFRGGPVSDKSMEEYLAHGIAYFVGRDRLMRPALVLRPARIPASWYSDKRAAAERLVNVLVFCIEYMMRYMLLPGRVEGGVVIMDMAGLSLSQVPFGPLKTILTILANHYVNRIFKFYLLHLPSALTTTLQFGMRLLTQRQQQKLVLLKSAAELLQEFAPHQLEVDFGGSRPAVDRFYPFPLQPGPFEAGSTNHANSNAMPNVHEAFTAKYILGHVWDPGLSREANVRLHFKEAARGILESCGVSLPALLVDAPGHSPGAAEEENTGHASEAQDALAVTPTVAEAAGSPVAAPALVASSTCPAVVAMESGMKVDAGPVLLGGVDGASGLGGGKPAKEEAGGGAPPPRPDAESTSAGSSEFVGGEESNGLAQEQISLQDSAVQPAMFCLWMPLCGAKILASKNLQHSN